MSRCGWPKVIGSKIQESISKMQSVRAEIFAIFSEPKWILLIWNQSQRSQLRYFYEKQSDLDCMLNKEMAVMGNHIHCYPECIYGRSCKNNSFFPDNKM